MNNRIHYIIRGSIKNVFTFLLFCVCFVSCKAQKMKNHLHKELIAKVGDIYEETPDDNPCAGSEIYLLLVFNEKQVTISEKEISTCDKESINEIGTYNWRLLLNEHIVVDFIPEQIENTYAEQLSLELRDKLLIASIVDLNRKSIEYIFTEIHKK